MNRLSRLIASMLLGAAVAAAQLPDAGTPDAAGDQPVTVFEHPESSRYWISGQINLITQGHGPFPAKYSGVNSLGPRAEYATSRTLTLYTGLELNASTEAVLDIESAGGHGLSGGAGLAGFTDLDIVRTPNLGQAPYLARFFIRKTIAFGRTEVDSERGPLELAARLPARRLNLTVGKFSLVDFFDVNPVGSDSHLQFMNWAVDNSGAYDYAANTRGYTWGAMTEYQDRTWALRFALAMMPKVANGENLDADLLRAHAENLELELRRSWLPGRHGVLRLLSFVNHADMGDYRASIAQFRAGAVPVPDITATRRQGRLKYGFGVNLEQDLTARVRAFARWGWNDGKTESFAYTEIDRTGAFGADFAGPLGRRPLDKIGAAFVLNGLSGDHREYLALGGHGFMLGDGHLDYGRELILETYYTAHLWRGLFGSFDLQHIRHPGYNRDRGPVLVPSVRLHVDF